MLKWSFLTRSHTLDDNGLFTLGKPEPYNPLSLSLSLSVLLWKDHTYHKISEFRTLSTFPEV